MTRSVRSSIRLVSGRYLDFDKLSEFTPTHYEIAVGLANTCRFAGQLAKFYSVAEHSVMVSHMVPPHLAYEALMHDWTEAFIHDITSTLKRRLNDYRRIEQEMEIEVNPRLGLPIRMNHLVKQAYVQALYAEKRDLMIGRHPDDDEFWADVDLIGRDFDHEKYTAEGLPPKAARILFLDRLSELYRQGLLPVSMSDNRAVTLPLEGRVPL